MCLELQIFFLQMHYFFSQRDLCSVSYSQAFMVPPYKQNSHSQDQQNKGEQIDLQTI